VRPPFDTVEHETAVAVVHAVVLHSTRSIASMPYQDAVALASLAPKLSPEIVTEAPPVCAPLTGLASMEMAGASNVKTLPVTPNVPTTAATVTATPIPAVPAEHWTAVSEVHAVVVHRLSAPMRAVAVPKSMLPNDKPLIVTLAPPMLAGALNAAVAVTTGPSNENDVVRVPTKLATVTMAPDLPQLEAPAAGTDAAGSVHRTIVDALHEVVEQGDAPCWICTVCVRVAVPKFAPVTVTEEPPEAGPFRLLNSVTTGASYEK
jgi:hypothetical protein